MQETPRRSTRALFASKPGDGGGAATPSSGLLFLDASVNLASPSGVHGFPTSAQQQHRFRRGALFGGAAEGAASGDKGAALGAAPLQAAFRGAARVKRHPKVATPHGCDPDAGDRSAGPRCAAARGPGPALACRLPGCRLHFPASPAPLSSLPATDARRWTALVPSHRGASAFAGLRRLVVAPPEMAMANTALALRHPPRSLYTLPHKRHGSPSSSPSTTSTRPSPNTRRGTPAPVSARRQRR